MIENSNKVPFISIAIASYNYAHYLLRGIKSIAGQSFKDFEVVYLDDDSKDDSVSIIHSIIEGHKDIHIRLVKNDKNMGILYSKTRLLRECRGKYIMLCDADDWMAEDCLEKLAKAAMKSDADRVVSEVININEDGKILQVQSLPEEPSKWMWNIHHGCLYKRSVIIDNNICIECEPDDVCFITKFNLYCKKTAWVHEKLYYWYVHTDSSGRATQSLKIETMTQKFEQAASYIYEIQRCMEYLKSTPNGNKDIGYLEILAMKVYYLQLYHSMRYYSIKDKIAGYISLKGIMQKYFPEYLKNAYIKSSKRHIRPYAYYIIRMSMVLEKLHIIKPALIAYHIVSRFIYLDQ